MAESESTIKNATVNPSAPSATREEAEDRLVGLTYTVYAIIMFELITTAIISPIAFEGSTLCNKYTGDLETSGAVDDSCNVYDGQAGEQQMIILFTGVISIVLLGFVGYQTYKQNQQTF